jgi:hypothetical protein
MDLLQEPHAETDEKVFCFQRVNHHVKNLIEDVADQKSEAHGLR